MTPLDKAKKAAFDVGYGQHDAVTYGLDDVDLWERIARAVLLAVREPSDEMLKAGFVAMQNTPGRTWKKMKNKASTQRELFDAKHKPRFTAMIDAILEGE